MFILIRYRVVYFPFRMFLSSKLVINQSFLLMGSFMEFLRVGNWCTGAVQPRGVGRTGCGTFNIELLPFVSLLDFM